jgi:hypothetical protein
MPRSRRMSMAILPTTPYRYRLKDAVTHFTAGHCR